MGQHPSDQEVEDSLGALLILEGVACLDDTRGAGAALTGRLEGCAAAGAAACGGACAGRGGCWVEADTQSQAHG